LIPGHRLSREILATLLSNDLVNRMGPAFAKRVQVDTGANIVTVARAYAVARVICRAGPLLRKIESMDYQIPASAQVSMMFEVSRTLRHACYWLIEQYGDSLHIVKTVDRLLDNMGVIYTRASTFLSRASRARHEKAEKHFIKMGVPEKLANSMSVLLLTRPALDMADIAADRNRDVTDVAKIYSTFNDVLGTYWLHNRAEDLKVDGRWQAIARSKLRDEFYRCRRDLASQLLTPHTKKSPDAIADTWLKSHAVEVERFTRMIAEMKLRDRVDFATLTVAAQELRNLVSN
jgi:glutamate dehydrogenase